MEQKELAYWEQRKSSCISTCRRQHAPIAAGRIYELEKAMKANMGESRYENKEERGVVFTGMLTSMYKVPSSLDINGRISQVHLFFSPYFMPFIYIYSYICLTFFSFFFLHYRIFLIYFERRSPRLPDPRCWRRVDRQHLAVLLLEQSNSIIECPPSPGSTVALQLHDFLKYIVSRCTSGTWVAVRTTVYWECYISSRCPARMAGGVKKCAQFQRILSILISKQSYFKNANS